MGFFNIDLMNGTGIRWEHRVKVKEKYKVIYIREHL